MPTIPFSQSQITTAIETHPERAKVMLEAYRQALDTRPKPTPVYRDPIFLAAATAIFALFQANFVETRKLQTNLIENAVSDSREETLNDLTFLLDAGLISRWRYGDIVAIAGNTFPAIAIVGSFSVLDNALALRRTEFPGKRMDVFQRNGYYAVAKQFDTFDGAQAFIKALPEHYQSLHKPYASLERDWCLDKTQDQATGLIYCAATR